MADKTIGELPSASAIYDDSLLVMEQQGEARSVLGSLFRGFAEAAAKEHADIARSHMDAARASAAVAAESLARLNGQAELAEEARKGAEKAREAIEDMTVSAETLPCWSEATAVKTATESSFSIHFGIPAGRGFTILGRYDSREELEAAVPDPAVGDAYQVGAGAPYDVYIYDDVNGWVNSGPINVDLPAHLIVGEDSELGTVLPVDADTLGGHRAEYFASDLKMAAELAKKQDVIPYYTNPNLLDNWYFAGGGPFPINQRGQTEFAEAGYTIDRWLANCAGGTKVYLRDDGIAPEINCNFEQRFPRGAIPPDTPLTLTVLRADNRIDSISFRTPVTEDYITTSGVIYTVFYTNFSGSAYNSMYFYEFAGNWDTIAIKAVKLELGSQQTLAHEEGDTWVLNEMPDYAEELAKCQRYYQVFKTGEKRPVEAEDFRPVMRIKPTPGAIEVSGVTYYTADANL